MGDERKLMIVPIKHPIMTKEERMINLKALKDIMDLQARELSRTRASDGQKTESFPASTLDDLAGESDDESDESGELAEVIDINTGKRK